MQKTYVSTLYKLMKQDKNVISCLSDSGTDYDEIIARELPLQVINYGISENNKVASASGLASCGKIPFVYTTNAFIAYRSYEFIRDDVCLQNRNVKLIGMGCGISWSTLGPTHHTTEDISSIINESKNYKKIISIEEHNIIGGLGSSIADVIATNFLDTTLYKIGINDTFAKGYGTYQEMKKMNNLDSESIYEQVKKILSI